MKIKKMILIPVFAVLIAGSGYFASAQTLPIRPDKMVEEIIGILGTLMGGGGSGGGASSQTGGWRQREFSCTRTDGTQGYYTMCGTGSHSCQALTCQ